MDDEWADDDRADEQRMVWEPIRPTSSNLSYWLRGADRSFTRSFSRLLQKAGIIASEWTALRALYRPQCWSPVELGTAIGMSKGGASKLVSRLVAKGLAIKRKHESDRRFTSVGLTRQGRELVVFLAAIEKDIERQYFGPLGNGGRFRLAQYMQHLLRSNPSRRMDQWAATQLQTIDFQPFTPEARARAADKARMAADEFWEYCRQVTAAAAAGNELPPLPEALR